MPTVAVTVEVEVGTMPDESARELARSLVESRGLTVARVAIKAASDRVKVWQPKAGAPGSTVVRDGRSFHVWAQAPGTKDALWLIPTEPREDDAPVYLCYAKGGRAHPHHTDGTACEPTWVYRDERGDRLPAPRQDPCGHQSHNRASKAA